VCCSEDYLEGTSIFDEYVPDQLGAVQRPVQTVAAAGLFGGGTPLMLFRSGAARVVAVEAHSKVSDVLTLGAIEQFAMDPVFNRPLGVPALAVAGLDMNAFLERTGLTEEHCAMVAAKNRTNALDNPRAAYPADVTAEDVEGSGPGSWPLREPAGAGGGGRRLRRGRARRRGAGRRPHRGSGVGTGRGVVVGESHAGEPNVGGGGFRREGGGARLRDGACGGSGGGDRSRRSRRRLRVQGAPAPRGPRVGDGGRAGRDAGGGCARGGWRAPRKRLGRLPGPGEPVRGERPGSAPGVRGAAAGGGGRAAGGGRGAGPGPERGGRGVRRPGPERAGGAHDVRRSDRAGERGGDVSGLKGADLVYFFVSDME